MWAWSNTPWPEVTTENEVLEAGIQYVVVESQTPTWDVVIARKDGADMVGHELSFLTPIEEVMAWVEMVMHRYLTTGELPVMYTLTDQIRARLLSRL